MEVLGHPQISTTMNMYAYVAHEFQKEARERVAAALWPGICPALVSKVVSNGLVHRRQYARNGFIDYAPL